MKNDGIKTSVFRLRMIRFGTELQCIVMVGSGGSRDGEREGESRKGMTEPLSFWGEGGRLQKTKTSSISQCKKYGLCNLGSNLKSPSGYHAVGYSNTNTNISARGPC